MEKAKIFISVLLGSAILLAFGIQREHERSDYSSIEWIKTEHDFGKIKQNISVTAEFEFRNNSLIPLVIVSVEPQCGCTVADYPMEPLTYGKKGVISISFDAKNRGYFQKSVLVQTNSEQGTTTLIIKGEVVKPSK
ncbi:MAG TPA: DUF1573 domain-containing protein [Bacteroidales bacterium]|nr:DUF1573 domain-containing protein [Bacteroidales bacterium]